MKEDSKIEYLMNKITDVDKLPTFEEVKSLYNHLRAQPGNEFSSAWHCFCSQNRIENNIYTVEFVDALAKEIKKLKVSFLSDCSPVLEINAGDGKLSHHLGERGIWTQATAEIFFGEVPNDSVEIMLAGKALEKYKPEIVVASPIPYGSCGIEVLSFPGVKYLIEIGVQERDGETWRNDERERLRNTAHHIEQLDVKHCIKVDTGDLDDKGPLEFSSIDLFVIDKE